MKPYRKWTAAKIIDLGEYSMVVNTVLPDIKAFRINGKFNTEHWAKEIIASEKGCVAYFDERIDKDFEIRGYDEWYNGNRPNKNFYYSTTYNSS